MKGLPGRVRIYNLLLSILEKCMLYSIMEKCMQVLTVMIVYTAFAPKHMNLVAIVMIKYGGFSFDL